MLLTEIDYYELYYGGPLVTNNSRYLWKHPEESPAAYAARKERASYPNFQEKIVNIEMGYVFFNEPQVAESVLDLKQLAKEATLHSIVGGKAYALATPEGVKIYPSTQVTRKTDKDSGEVEYEITGVNGKICVYPKAKKIEYYVNGTEVTEDLIDGQFVCIKWNEPGLSMLRDTAGINIQIYNKKSWLDSLLFGTTITIPYGPAIDAAKPENFKYITVGSDEQPPGFAQPSVSAAQTLRNEIDLEIMLMGKIVGLESEFSDVIRIQSGVSRAYEMLDTVAGVTQIASSVSKGINECAAAYETLTGQKGGAISLSPIKNDQMKHEKLSTYRALMTDVRTELVTKWAQSKIVALIAADEPEQVRLNLVKDVEANGGLNSAPARVDLTM